MRSVCSLVTRAWLALLIAAPLSAEERARLATLLDKNKDD